MARELKLTKEDAKRMAKECIDFAKKNNLPLQKKNKQTNNT